MQTRTQLMLGNVRDISIMAYIGTDLLEVDLVEVVIEVSAQVNQMPDPVPANFQGVSIVENVVHAKVVCTFVSDYTWTRVHKAVIHDLSAFSDAHAGGLGIAKDYAPLAAELFQKRCSNTV